MGKTTSRSASANELRTIDLSILGHREMLASAYREVYEPAFPNRAHREPLEHWIERLEGDPPTPDRYVIIVVGENLDDPKTRFIKGVGVGIYLETAQAGWMAYNAIRPECREGLGHLLLDARREALEGMAASKQKSLKGIFAEVQDPAKPGKNDIYDPQKRLDKFKSWGAEVVDIKYVQPALTTDIGEVEKGKSKNLLLVSYPIADGSYATPNVTQAFLHAVYTADGDVAPEDDKDFCRMFVELENLKTAKRPALALVA